MCTMRSQKQQQNTPWSASQDVMTYIPRSSLCTLRRCCEQTLTGRGKAYLIIVVL